MMKCKFLAPDGNVYEGQLLAIDAPEDGKSGHKAWFTVLPDGYAASNQLRIECLIKAWTADDDDDDDH